MPSINFDVFWRDHGAARGAQALGRTLDQSYRNAVKFGNAGSSFGKIAFAVGAVSRVTAMGAAALGQAGVAAVGWGLKVQAGNETARVAFIRFLGSAKAADKMVRDLQRFAATTPFEFPELQQLAPRLLAAGIEGDKVIPILRSVGDAVAGTGGGTEQIQRAITALTQMRLAGKITGQDLLQLKDAGIDTFSLIAEATGRSKKEVAALAKEGKLSGKDLDAVFDQLAKGGIKRFEGAMKDQSKTLTGLFSTLKDTIGLGLGQMIKPLIPQLKGIMGNVTEVMGSLERWAKRNKGSIKDLFGTIISILGSFWRVAKGTLGAFIEGLSGSGNATKDFAKFVEDARPKIVRAFGKWAEMVLVFAETFAIVASGAARAVAKIMRLMSGMVGFAVKVFDAILVAAESAFRWDPIMGPKIRAARRRLGEFRETAIKEFDEAAGAFDDFAAGVDNKVTPAIRKARQKLLELMALELDKNFQSKSKKAERAINGIGKAAGDNKGKIDDLAAAMKGGGTRADDLKTAVRKAESALTDKFKAAKKAGAQQDTLNGMLKTGKQRLRDELIELGLGKEEARKWADKIANAAAKQAGLNVKVRDGTGRLKDQTGASRTNKTESGKLAGSWETAATRAAALERSSNRTRVSLDKSGDQMRTTGGQARGLGTSIGTIKARSVWLNFTSNARDLARKLGIRFAARGGPIFGPGGGTDDQIPAMLSNGEFVVNARQSAKYRSLLHAINSGKEGLPPSAEMIMGGPSLWRRAPRFALGGQVGIPGINVRDIPSAAIALPPAMRRAWDSFGDRVRSSLFGKILDRMKSLVGSLLDRLTSIGTGPGVGSYSAGMAGTIARMRAAGARSFTTYPGHHPSMAKARDVTPHNWRLANIARAASSVWYVIYRMRIASKRHGNRWLPYVPRNFRGDWRHVRHIHVAWFDQGGVAGINGPQFGLLGGNGPERVLTPRQTKQFDRLVTGTSGGGRPTTVINHYHFPHYVGSANDLRAALVKLERSGSMALIKR